MTNRPRRLRTTPALRELVAETRVHPAQLIQPHFVHAADAETPIPSMPGISRMDTARLVDRVGADLDLGLASVLLFGVTEGGDPQASAATDPEGVVPTAVRALKDAFGERLVVMTDVCLCGATDHGHCGVLRDGKVLNDESLPLLVAMALAHAAAGADVVAPSDMMDLRVGAIAEALEDEGYHETALMAYSSKFASAFYGPFRDAADSAPQAGDRKTYQLDPRNGWEALRESLIDEAEGADILMVKPALAYLDVIARVADATTLPVAAYNVSGEYSMVKATAEKGWIDEARVVGETLHAFARGGADMVITYHGRDALAGGWLG